MAGALSTRLETILQEMLARGPFEKTLAEAFFLAVVSSYTDTEAWIIITLLMVFANLSVVFFCGCSRVLYSFGYGVLCAVPAVLALGVPGVVLWVMVYKDASTILTPIYAVILAIIFCLDQLVSMSLMVDGWKGPVLTRYDHFYISLQTHLYMVLCFGCNSVFVCGKCFDFCC